MLPNDLKDAITIAKIKEARDVITKGGFIRKTPILDGSTINGLGKSSTIADLKGFSMKCENMQFSG